MIYNLDQFSDDIRSSLQRWPDRKDVVLSLGPFMQRLAREGGELWQLGEPATISSGLPGRRLAKDPEGRFTLLLASTPRIRPPRHPPVPQTQPRCSRSQLPTEWFGHRPDALV